MRFSRSLALLAVLAPSAHAFGQELTAAPAADAPAATATVAATPPAVPAPSLPWIGIMADAGIPDGMQGSIVLRPWKALRASVGGGYNMVSKGVRLGLTLVPFGHGPSGTLEAGHYFEGDATSAAAKFFGPGVEGSAFGPTLQRIGYDYANAHLGLDFGYKRVTFYIHGGMSYVRAQVHHLDQVINNMPSINGQNANGLEISVPQDVTVKYIGPSGKIGLIVYFG
jgi:hypothetical protein